MTIRRATPADAADLSRIHAASFDDGWTIEDFTTWLSRPEGIAMIAASEREPVAFGLALEAGADAELLSIATDPALRRGGWGRQIFRALDEEAHARGLERWILEVARNNVAAQGLYRSHGFVEIGVRKAYYKTSDGRVDAIVMSRRVGGQDSA
jgi:ribosomal-protein-alanine N-acetyltransferase